MTIVLNGQPFGLPSNPCSITALIEHLQLTGKRLAAEVNGDIVPRSLHAQTELRDGDRVEIVQAIGGG